MTELYVSINHSLMLLQTEETATLKDIIENEIGYCPEIDLSIDGDNTESSKVEQPLSALGFRKGSGIQIQNDKPMVTEMIIAGCSCTIISRLKLEDIIWVKEHNPDALRLMNKKGKVTFSIDYEEESPGSLVDDQAIFGSVTSNDGRATITVVLDPSAKDMIELVNDKLKSSFYKIVSLEDNLLFALRKEPDEDLTIKSRIIWR